MSQCATTLQNSTMTTFTLYITQLGNQTSTDPVSQDNYHRYMWPYNSISTLTTNPLQCSISMSHRRGDTRALTHATTATPVTTNNIVTFVTLTLAYI